MQFIKCSLNASQRLERQDSHRGSARRPRRV